MAFRIEDLPNGPDYVTADMETTEAGVSAALPLDFRSAPAPSAWSGSTQTP
jgi:hypothetical protein